MSCFFFFCFLFLAAVCCCFYTKAKNQTLALSYNETPKNIKIVVDATGKKKQEQMDRQSNKTEETETKQFVWQNLL